MSAQVGVTNVRFDDLREQVAAEVANRPEVSVGHPMAVTAG